MPPPEPRSRTVSPAFSSASAVGLPQPSDASSAVSGQLRFCVVVEIRGDGVAAPCRSTPMLRNRNSPADGYAQRGLAVLLFHNFFYVGDAHDVAPYPQQTIPAARTARFRAQHSAKRNPSKRPERLRVRRIPRKVPSRRTLTRSSFLSLSRWCESVELGISSSLPISPTTMPSGCAESRSRIIRSRTRTHCRKHIGKPRYLF